MREWPEVFFKNRKTPFYYYDMQRLGDDVARAKEAASRFNYHIHYAIKANHEQRILQLMRDSGFGADCVSENELRSALKTGFAADDILLAGVGKTDEEITLAIKSDIKAIHVESIEELEVIEEIAKELNRPARVAFRINPNVDAMTHPGITTGLNENKFGIPESRFEQAIDIIRSSEHIDLIGLHFHIGSQIEKLEVFKNLALRVNDIIRDFESKGAKISYLNLGGGLGIDYDRPENKVDFEAYFSQFHKLLELEPSVEVHFELGRSLVGQCGNLVSKVLYVKKGEHKEFLILDAGMTELIRPALYNSFHQVEVLNDNPLSRNYDIVGPVCESSDLFARNRSMPLTKRNDIVVIRSAGAYGQVMSSNYNLRPNPKAVFSDEMPKRISKKKVIIQY